MTLTKAQRFRTLKTCPISYGDGAIDEFESDDFAYLEIDVKEAVEGLMKDIANPKGMRYKLYHKDEIFELIKKHFEGVLEK